MPFWHIDTGMAGLLILQTAVDEGLGAVYFGIVPEAVAPFRAAFGVPDDQEPIGAIAIGYDAEADAAESDIVKAGGDATREARDIAEQGVVDDGGDAARSGEPAGHGAHAARGPS